MPPAHRQGPRALVFASACISALTAAPASAAPAPPYAELVTQLASGPRLAAGEAAVRQSEGLAQQAYVRPNPVISLEVENIAGSRPYRGLDRAETTLLVGQSFELGGKRGARIAAGKAEVDAARARASAARVEFAVTLAETYAQAEAADLRLERAQDEVEDAGEDLRAARALVEAGKEAQLRALQAETVLRGKEAELDGAASERLAAYARLSALAGEPVPYTALSTSLFALAERPPLNPTVDPLDTPAYLALKAEREAVARRVRVEQTRALPDMTASLGVRRLEGDDATAFLGVVSMPLPAFDRNRGNVAAVRAELEGIDARLNLARIDAEADLRAALARVTAAQSRLAAASNAETVAQEAYRLARIGYQAGKASLVELLSVRRALGEALSSAITARLARVTAETALARLQGRIPFSGSPA